MPCRPPGASTEAAGRSAARRGDVRAQLARYLAALEQRYGAPASRPSTAAGSEGLQSPSPEGLAQEGSDGGDAALGRGFTRQLRALSQRLAAERRRDGRRARGAPVPVLVGGTAFPAPGLSVVSRQGMSYIM